MNIGTVTVTMNNWIVESDHSILLGTSGENAVARLDIITTVDDGWIYMLEIEHLDRGEKNIIPLTAETNKVYAVLTSEMLGNRGGKKLQIRAINGEQVKKSNVFRGYVNNSVNASENIPEHTQTVIDEAVERVDELATNAQSSAAAAETSATNAQSSAAAAETSATNAGNSAAALQMQAIPLPPLKLPLQMQAIPLPPLKLPLQMQAILLPLLKELPRKRQYLKVTQKTKPRTQRPTR